MDFIQAMNIGRATNIYILPQNEFTIKALSRNTPEKQNTKAPNYLTLIYTKHPLQKNKRKITHYFKNSENPTPPDQKALHKKEHKKRKHNQWLPATH
jgi:hypothetical protein